MGFGLFVLGVLVLLALVGSMTRAQQRSQHHDICSHCGAKLRFGFFSNRFSPDCPKCGQRQAWASGGNAPAAAAPAPLDTADQLRKLADLRDTGVITEEEFAAQKSKLLNS